jgi:hypothetical protein
VVKSRLATRNFIKPAVQATRRWATLLVLIAAPNLAYGSALRLEEGIARSPQSAAELFREQHWIRSAGSQPVERLVIYRCPDGIAFGRKRIDYRDSSLAPAFLLEDRRSGYREGLRRDAAPALFFRPDATTAERSAPLASARLVADAGFDEFIRLQWSRLIAGQTLPLEFAVPSRLRSMAFSVSRAGETMLAGEKAWVFRLKLDGLLGWLVPAIEVSYGQQSRRLLRFEGLSNLRDDAGKQPLVARIDFADPARAASEEQWQAALKTPLSACRAGR